MASQFIAVWESCLQCEQLGSVCVQAPLTSKDKPRVTEIEKFEK